MGMLPRWGVLPSPFLRQTHWPPISSEDPPSITQLSPFPGTAQLPLVN